MAIPLVPNTDARLVTATSFYILREDAVSPAAIFGTINPSNIISHMMQVLAITNFTENQSRTTTSRWETDSDIPGQALEVLQSPTDRTLSIKRMVLYSSDFIDIARYGSELTTGGITDGSILNQQQKPFIFIRLDTMPPNSNLSNLVTMYRGCIFTSIGRTYSLDRPTDLSVSEDVEVKYGARQQLVV
jgi:hypothetical protein